MMLNFRSVILVFGVLLIFHIIIIMLRIVLFAGVINMEVIPKSPKEAYKVNMESSSVSIEFWNQV